VLNQCLPKKQRAKVDFSAHFRDSFFLSFFLSCAGTFSAYRLFLSFLLLSKHARRRPTAAAAKVNDDIDSTVRPRYDSSDILSKICGFAAKKVGWSRKKKISPRHSAPPLSDLASKLSRG
jgi:hypothetical protein